MRSLAAFIKWKMDRVINYQRVSAKKHIYHTARRRNIKRHHQPKSIFWLLILKRTQTHGNKHKLQMHKTKTYLPFLQPACGSSGYGSWNWTAIRSQKPAQKNYKCQNPWQIKTYRYARASNSNIVGWFTTAITDLIISYSGVLTQCLLAYRWT